MKPDLPEKLLSWAVRWLPRSHQEWGMAMEREISEIRGPAERWRFAIGCAWASLFPPGRSGKVMAMANGRFRDFGSRPSVSAVAGLLALLPFAVMNAIVVTRMEPIFSMVRPGLHTSLREYVVLAAVLLVMPVGAYVSLRPALNIGADGKWRVKALGVASAVLVLAVFATISYALGAEIYACEVMQIPNCD